MKTGNGSAKGVSWPVPLGAENENGKGMSSLVPLGD
jgi:hypothetical protein